jgi:small subunit ribosomal protein S6
LRQYELVIIINPELGEDETQELIQRIKGIIESGGGQVLKVDLWGSKRLAYSIKRHRDGYYVLYLFEASSGLVQQLSSAIQLIESILRHMIVRFEGELDKALSSGEDAAPQEATGRSEEGMSNSRIDDGEGDTSEDDSENGDEEYSDANEPPDEF